MKPKSKFVLITGASTGIGYGAAKELIRRGYTVFGSVRKKEDADRVKSELGAGFLPLLFDVTDAAAVGRAVAEVKGQCNGQGLGGLINNSGISVPGPIELLSVEEIAYNFEVNVFGLLRVTKAFLPLLGAQKDHPSSPGRILNMSSAAGKLAGPYMAPYAGTKHALEGISHAMRLEFMRYGITVIIIGPGAIRTPIWDKTSLRRFEGTLYYDSLAKFYGKALAAGKDGMPLEKCSRQIGDIFETERPKIRHAIVQNRFFKWTLPMLLPQRALDKFFKKMM
ncbi:MAG: SDR family oxidoreductase [Betaproteobacteria bacterium]|nr:SDR family oxidoreductase [Betaproteobacteria bacterium]